MCVQSVGSAFSHSFIHSLNHSVSQLVGVIKLGFSEFRREQRRQKSGKNAHTSQWLRVAVTVTVISHSLQSVARLTYNEVAVAVAVGCACLMSCCNSKPNKNCIYICNIYICVCVCVRTHTKCRLTLSNILENPPSLPPWLTVAPQLLNWSATVGSG